MTEKTPMWLVEDRITAARIASQDGRRELTIKRLEEALALAKGEKEHPLTKP